MLGSRGGHYFAYGSNMDQSQMAARGPRASLNDKGELLGYRFIINTRGVASVVPEVSHQVWGVLWTIAGSDEESLDKYEGVKPGYYRKAMVCVEKLGKNPVSALIYIATNNTPGRPRSDYLEKILRAAEFHGLPEEYIQELESWLDMRINTTGD